MNSLRPMLAWPKWTRRSFSAYANRKILANEFTELSNSLKQLLCLPRALIRVLYLSPIEATFSVEVRITDLERMRESFNCSDLWETLWSDSNSNWWYCASYRHNAKSNIVSPKQTFFHFQGTLSLVLNFHFPYWNLNFLLSACVTSCISPSTITGNN